MAEITKPILLDETGKQIVEALQNLSKAITPIGIPREVSKDGVYQMPSSDFTFSLPDNATDLADRALYNAFFSCSGLTSVDLSSLTTVSGWYALNSAFKLCSGLTSVDLSSLTTVSGLHALEEAFYSCKGLTSVDLSSLTTASGNYVIAYAFWYCSGLTSVDLSSLTTVSGNSAMSYTFASCTKLKELSFPALTSHSFGNNSNQFNKMLNSVTGCTVHFPANLESVIGSWSDVISGFGGTNTTVLFDLPATE